VSQEKFAKTFRFWLFLDSLLVFIQHCVKTVSIDFNLQYYCWHSATTEAVYHSIDNSVYCDIYCDNELHRIW